MDVPRADKGLIDVLYLYVNECMYVSRENVLMSSIN